MRQGMAIKMELKLKTHKIVGNINIRIQCNLLSLKFILLKMIITQLNMKWVISKEGVLLADQCI